MNGAGNRFILGDVRGRTEPLQLTADQVREMARRHAFDQLLILEDSPQADAYMRIWNADGDEVGACGNGTRAAAWAMMRANPAKTVSIDTDGGLLLATQPGEMTISVDMGRPRLNWQDIPLARASETRELTFTARAGDIKVSAPGAVNMGNPHAVFFVANAEDVPVAVLGPEIEMDPTFPKRVNASFAQIYDRTHIRLRVWERGAGITAACGTAACATLVAANRRGLADRKASIMADGGELHVEWRESDDHVILTGPVEDEGPVEIEL